MTKSEAAHEQQSPEGEVQSGAVEGAVDEVEEYDEADYEDIEAAEEAAAEAVAPAFSEEVKVRRAPRYARFMILGGFVFAIFAFIVTYSIPQGAGYDRNTVFGFTLVVLATVGVALGALVAVIVDRVSARRSRTVAASRLDVRMGEDAPSDPE